MTHGHLNLPHIAIRELAAPYYGSSYKDRLSQTFTHALYQPHGSTLLERLGSDQRVAELAANPIQTGAASGHLHAHSIAQWYLWRANEVGANQAESDLNSYLDGNEVDVQVVQWVHGISTTDRLELPDGAELCSIADVPDSDTKEYVLQAPSRPYVQAGSMPSAALIKQCRVGKIDRDGSGHAIILSEIAMEKIAVLMNCLPNTCCVFGSRMCLLPSHVPPGPFVPEGGGRTIMDVYPYRNQPFDSEQTGQLNDLWEGMERCDWGHNGEDHWLGRALWRFAQAKARATRYDRALDLGISLEMVLIPNRNSRDQKQKFRERGAAIAGDSEEERITASELLKHIYERRSDVGHQGFSEVLARAAGDQPEGDQDAHFTLAEKIFRRLVIGGQPQSWDRILSPPKDSIPQFAGIE